MQVIELSLRPAKKRKFAIVTHVEGVVDGEKKYQGNVYKIPKNYEGKIHIQNKEAYIDTEASTQQRLNSIDTKIYDEKNNKANSTMSERLSGWKEYLGQLLQTSLGKISFSAMCR